MRPTPVKVIVLGATGGCVDIVDAIHDINRHAARPPFECVGLLDDNPDLHGARVLGAPVLGPFTAAATYVDTCMFVTGIGSPYNFWRKGRILDALGIPADRYISIVHPTASVSASAEIGRGCVLLQHVTVASRARLGDHVQLLPGSVVSHDSVVGDYSIVTAGVTITGDVHVGASCYLGANSVIRQNLTVADHCQVGMGAVVLQAVPANSVVVGNPARFLRRTRAED